MLEIKKITMENLDDLVFLEKNCFNNPFKKDDFVYEINDNPFSFIYGLFLDNKLIGYIDYWITFESSTISKIAVLKEYQNNGYGTKLLEFIINNLKIENSEVHFITLEVRVSNIIAINLYKKFNFEIVNVKKNYYENKEDALYMVKGI